MEEGEEELMGGREKEGKVGDEVAKSPPEIRCGLSLLLPICLGSGPWILRN